MGILARRGVLVAGIAFATLTLSAFAARLSAAEEKKVTAMNISRKELVDRLVRSGVVEVEGASPEEIASYFDTEKFRFHGPGGFETDYAGLQAYFKSIRDAFDDRSISHGIIIVEGNHVACQTWIEGRFVREFTMSPAGPLPPNGKKITWDLINIFVFNNDGRLVEEYVRTDYRSFLSQLGAQGK